MLFKQFYLNCLAHASYIIGDPTSGIAAVVDPQRDIGEYVAYAEAHRLRIAHVFLTHFHADFVAGHLELRERTGATIYLGAAAKAEYAFTPLHDQDRVAFGRLRLTALETPGHTAESISILVYDLERSDTIPHAVLTGDTLFVGDVGRPDLRVALGWSATELAGRLFDSVHDKLLPLPDETLVYPAHGAGSLCGKALSKETFSTIGEQRRSNYALQPMSRAAFIGMVTADQPDAPPYFTYDAMLNSRERPTLDEALARVVNPITLDRLLALQSAGAQILDVRDPAEFAAVHLAGSINVGLEGQFATWAGTILDHALPIVIVAEPGRESEAATRLGRIGFDHVDGYLHGGLESVQSRADLTVATERLGARVAAARLALDGRAATVAIDVRGPDEREQKRIAGSLAVPLSRLIEQLDALPAGRPLLVYCAGGYRSSIAASVLQARGFSDVSELAGGIAAWQGAGLPTESGAVPE